MENKQICIDCKKEFSPILDPIPFIKQEDGSFICRKCLIKGKTCQSCGKLPNKHNDFLKNFILFEGEYYCGECKYTIQKEVYEKIKITSTLNFEGYEIKEYLGFDSVEIVIGTGLFSEFKGALSDLIGERSSAFEKKLQDAKNMTILLLQKKAYEKGANAIVGIDMDFTEFSNNRVGIILSGTFVFIHEL